MDSATILESPSVRTIEWRMMDKKKFFTLNFINSFAIRGVLYPLTVIKTRLQLQRQHSVYKGTIDAYFKIIKYEGSRGLYKGFWINSIQICSAVCYISTYEKVRDVMTTYGQVQDNKIKSFVAGACASLVGQTIIIPFDIISQHMMVLGQYVKVKGGSERLNPLGIKYQSKSKLNIALDITKEVFRRDGIPGFYRGYVASLCVYVPHSAMWWSFYSLYAQSILTFFPASTPHLLIQCIAAPMSGVTAACITNPLDCIRARLQVRN